MSTDNLPAIGARERALIMGDLRGLTEAERTAYYLTVCESVGLNPATQPFAYIELNKRLVLYARRDATDQLRKLHGVSIVSLAEEVRENVYIVTATARDKAGRVDVAKGAVAIGGLKGDALANAIMKAETKAKRRVTLSLCGLGFLDETEVETVPGAALPAPVVSTTAAPQIEHHPDPPANGKPPADPNAPIGEDGLAKLRAHCERCGWEAEGENGWLAWLGWHPSRPFTEITRGQAKGVWTAADKLAAAAKERQAPAPAQASAPTADPAPAGPLVTVAQLDELRAELARTGKSEDAVYRLLRHNPTPAGLAGLTQEQWQTVMDRVTRLPAAAPAAGGAA